MHHRQLAHVMHEKLVAMCVSRSEIVANSAWYSAWWKCARHVHVWWLRQYIARAQMLKALCLIIEIEIFDISYSRAKRWCLGQRTRERKIRRPGDAYLVGNGIRRRPRRWRYKTLVRRPNGRKADRRIIASDRPHRKCWPPVYRRREGRGRPATACRPRSSTESIAHRRLLLHRRKSNALAQRANGWCARI